MNEHEDRWAVVYHYDAEACKKGMTKNADGTSSVSMGGIEPTCYRVVDVYGDDDYGRSFKTAGAAQRRADEMNRLERQGPLDPAFADRRKRLAAVRRQAEMFGLQYGSTPDPPNRPERYAAVAYSERYSQSFTALYGSLEEAREQEGSDLDFIVDLDTGQKWNAEVNVRLVES